MNAFLRVRVCWRACCKAGGHRKLSRLNMSKQSQGCPVGGQLTSAHKVNTHLPQIFAANLAYRCIVIYLYTHTVLVHQARIRRTHHYAFMLNVKLTSCAASCTTTQTMSGRFFGGGVRLTFPPRLRLLPLRWPSRRTAAPVSVQCSRCMLQCLTLFTYQTDGRAASGFSVDDERRRADSAAWLARVVLTPIVTQPDVSDLRGVGARSPAMRASLWASVENNLAFFMSYFISRLPHSCKPDGKAVPATPEKNKK